MPAYSFQSLTLRSEIGANCYVLDLGGERLILDSGMHPKEEGPDAIPRFQEIPFDSADGILISHSHLDHIGTLPLVQRDHPSAPVYLTPGTAALGDALLHNSVNVMSSQRTELGIAEYPLFHHREIDFLKDRWMERDYERPFKLDPSGELETEITLHDAGHILGSAAATIRHQDKTIFYSGDVHFYDHSLIRGAKFPELKEPDLLILETTRGANRTPEGHSRKREKERFGQALAETLEGGGSALVPVFAIGKTQEILTMIDQFKDEGIIPVQTPVLIGGLSTKMTGIYDRFSRSTRRSRPGFEILKDMDVITGKKRRSRQPIEYKPGAIYCLSSGMMSEKTVSNVFARGFLPNPQNALLFVGYADPDTPGGKIKAASTGDTISLDSSHKIPLQCRVEEFDFSGHATREELLDFAIEMKPKQILLVHGDPEASAWFLAELSAALPETEVHVPQPLKHYWF